MVMMLPPIAPFSKPKNIWRKLLKAERKAAATARPDAGAHAARNFLSALSPRADQTVALYFPIEDELDTEPLAAALVELGVPIALPVVVEKKAPLLFRAYRPGDALIDGAYGEQVPAPAAAVVVPDIVVAPLLGFTRAGGRLGYGGGYYDRTLAALRKTKSILAVGYGFGAQEVDALPLSPLDQKMDWIVTEREAVRC